MVTIARQQAIANSGLSVSNTSSGTSIGGSTTSAPSTAPKIATPSQVSTAITAGINNTSSKSGGSTNPHDAPGYNPATDPTSSAYDPSATGVDLSTSAPVSMKQPLAPTNPATQGLPQTQLKPTDQVPQSMVDQVSQASGAVDQLKQKYTKALTDIKGTGVEAPATQGSANAGLQAALKTQPENNPLPPAVENFFKPENPVIAESTKAIMEWLNPESDRKLLNDHIKQLASDRAELSGLKTDLMNTKRVMEGTEQDIRDEVTKAGGFATDSQVQALTLARNKSLVQKAQLISDRIQSQTDLVNSDVSLIGDEKQMAAQQFNQRMSLMNYQQENQRNMENAAKDTFKTVVGALGYDGAYQAYQNDPTQLQRIEQISGLGSGGFLKAATLAQQQRQTEQTKSDLQNQILKSNLLTDQYQRANIQSQIGERSGGVVGGLDEKTMGKIQSSPEYKTINGVLPALQSLVAYKNAIDKYGTFEQLSGEGKGELSGTYGNALAAWKTLAGLGALSGADFSLAENAVPSTGLFKRNVTAKSKLDTSINNAIQQATNLTQRLSQNYPKAAPILENQLDQMKVISNPNKFKVTPDGQVIELTDVK